MVSIIDHSRLANLGNFMIKKESKLSTNIARYSKQREQEAIRQAEENGYFLNLSKSFIKENLAPEADMDDADDDRTSVIKFLQGKETYKDINRIFVINLSKAHIRSLGDIGVCRNLTICNLPNNFITNFDVLSTCFGLTKLDLHGNQISSLPHSSVWSSLVFLQFLHLHDNPIGDISAIHNLAGCQNLNVLTIYDTPLSLRKNYRHHVVNSIWSLKALDKHVISDEEIIEDAAFRGRFATTTERFKMDLCPTAKEDATFASEIRNIQKLLKDIDKILKHNSPVLIIQRHFRGYRARRNLTDPSLLQFRQSKLRKQGSKSYFPALGEPVKVPTKVADSMEDVSMRIDYDSYISHDRPGSSKQVTDRSDVTTHRGQGDSVSREDDRRIPRDLQINLKKLQSTMIQLSEHPTETDTVSLVPKPAENYRKQSSGKKKEEKKDGPKFKRIKDVKQFFGKVVKNLPPLEDDDSTTNDDLIHDDLPIIKCRLQGSKVNPLLYDPTFEMIMQRREAGHEVRLAEADYHRHTDFVPKPKIQKQKRMNNEQRFFTKTQGSMGLACLQAVQQAYKDRDAIEKKAGRTNYVQSLRQQRDQGKSRVKTYQEERRNTILREREQDHRSLSDALEHREYTILQDIDKMQEKRHKSQQFSHQRKGELSFVSDFNAQITSVSKALMKENSKKKREYELTNRSERIMSHKVTSQENQEIVKKFLAHRRMMRQTESAIHRAALDTKMIEVSNDRLKQAQTRVKSLRTRHDTLRELAFPVIQSPSPQVTRNKGDAPFDALVM